MKIATIEVTLMGSYGDDLNVVNAARVSFHKETNHMTDKDKELIKYLADHKHHSPFNHSFLSFRIKAPLYVAAQLHKHEYMPVNSVSRRYVDEEPQYFQTQWRWKAPSVKQGSCGEVDTDTQTQADKAFGDLCEHSIRVYNELLDMNICPEQARRALLVDAATEWIWSGTLKAFLKMLSLRLDPHAQLESQEVAKLVAKEVKKVFPVSYEAYLGVD